MRIKVWLYKNIQREARQQHLYIDYSSASGQGIADLDNSDYVEVSGQLVRETEKAILVRLSTGLFGGSSKGYEHWLPKSQVIL